MPAPKNRRNLTDRVIRSLKPGESETDYMDSSLEGFGLRVRPSGKRSFFVRYRVGRGLRRFQVGDYPILGLGEARARAIQVLAAVQRGEDPQGAREARRGEATFGDLCADYMERHAKLKKITWRQDEQKIEAYLLPRWRGRAASSITRREVADLLEGLAQRAPIQANRVKALLSKMFKHGRLRELLPENFDPVRDLDRPAPERHRDRVLTAEEIRKLWRIWEEEKSVVSAAFRVFLLTAQRPGEVLRMRWKDIQGSWWKAAADSSKNGRSHIVYLTPTTQAVLQEVRGASEEWVFASSRVPGEPIVAINNAAERYRAVSGMQDWRPYDLKSTAVTNMSRLGVSRFDVRRVVNHVDQEVTARYDLYRYEAEIERALTLWADRLTEILKEHGGSEGPSAGLGLGNRLTD
jgi:integrase